MLANLILSLVTIFISWTSINYFVYKYDQVDRRSGLQVYAELYKSDPNVITRLTPYAFNDKSLPKLIDAYAEAKRIPDGFNIFEDNTIKTLLGSIPDSKMVYCQEDEGWYISNQDRYGFSNPDKIWEKEKDILILGDSFAQGACTHSNTQHHLNKTFNRNTISLGMGGNGPLTSFASLKEYLAKHDAKHIVWLIVENDIYRPIDSKLDVDFEVELSNDELRKYISDENHTQDYFNLEKLRKVKDYYQTFNKFYFKANKNNILTKTAEHKKLEDNVTIDILTGSFLKKRWERLKHSFTGNNNAPTYVQTDTPGEFIKTFSDGTTKIVKLRNNKLTKENQNTILELYKRANELTMRKGSKLSFVFLHSVGHCQINYTNDQFSFIRDFLKSNNMKFSDYKPGEHPSCLSFFARKMGGHYNAQGYLKLAELINSITN